MTMECIKGCGFFGSTETGNMCSKCYKDFINTRTFSDKPISAVNFSANEKLHEIGAKLSNGGNQLLPHWQANQIELCKIGHRKSNLIEAVLSGDETLLSAGSNAEVEMSKIAAVISRSISLVDRFADENQIHGIDGQDESSEISEKIKNLTIKTKKKTNRCECCNKKVGLLGFQCRCGGVFCGQHRMPELHTCEFDYKDINNSKVNPHLTLVKADKLEYRI